MKPRTTWVAVLLFGICALLRIPLATWHGLWVDEAFSLAMATGHSLEHPAAAADVSQGDYVELPKPVPSSEYRRYLEHDSPPVSPSRVVRAVFQSDTSPPLYYLLLNGWTRLLGTSDPSLRMFSVLLALASFPLLWSLGRQVDGTRTAIAACLLFTFSPMAIYYSTEGRMYSLLWFTTLATMGLTIRMHRSGTDLQTLTLWVLAAAAGLMTHYFFAFVLAALGIWILIAPGRATRSRIVLGALVIGALVAPWYVYVPSTLANWRVTHYWLNMPPDGFSRVRDSLLLPWRFLSVRRFGGIPIELDALNAIVIALIIMIALLRRPRLRPFTPERSLLWMCAIAAWAGLVFIDAWGETFVIRQPRYALAGFPAALLLLGSALAHLPVVLRRTLSATIIVIWLIGDTRIFLNPDRGSPTRDIAALINTEARADDAVIVSSIPSGVAAVARYMTVPSGREPGFASWVGQLNQRRIPDDIVRLAAGRRRLVLVRFHEVGAPSDHVHWMRAHFRLTRSVAVGNGTIDFFSPPTSDHFTADGAERVAAPHAGQ